MVRPFTCATVALVILELGGCTPKAKINPELSRIHYRLGNDYYGKKKPELAKTELITALKHNPKNRAAHALLGAVFFLEGVHAQNFVDRRQCLKGPAKAQQREVVNRQFRRAEQHLKQSTVLAKKDEKSVSNDLNLLANIALHFKRYDEAIVLTTRALEDILYANRYAALGTRGWAHFEKGDRQAAAKDLRQALFHKPAFCIGRYRLGRVLYEMKQYDQAIAQFELGLKDKQCQFIQEFYKFIGLSYRMSKRAEDAKSAFLECTRSPRSSSSCIAEECTRYAKLM